MDKYIVNQQQETEEGNVSLEDQLAQQEAAQQQTQQNPSGQENTQAAEDEQTKAEDENLILGKFKSQEDLAAAYENLEKKLGETKEEPAAEENSTKDSNVSTAIQEASNSFYENGGLSEDNYKALEASGIPREFVEDYVKGREASMESEAAQITNSVGGQENYDAMAQWASEALPADEIDTFDKLVTESSPEAAKLAVKGLYARYAAESGNASLNIKQGQTSGAAIQPFNSNAQVVEAMKDKRYENDPAYREEIERRLAVSTRV